MLLHIPAVQRIVASETAEALSEKLGTKVSIGNVNLGFLNRAIIDDVIILDQQHHDMFLCHRLSAKVDILPLLSGKISISSAQIFGLQGQLTKASATAPLNCQFMLDSLASKDTTSHTPLDLHISSLVIRNTSLTYDRLDLPRKHNGLDVNHLALDKISSHIMLYTLTDDSLSVRMKKLALAERNTGFAINSLTFDLNAGKHSAQISDFNLITDGSDTSFDAYVAYQGKEIKKFSLLSKHSSVSLKDVACFVPELKDHSNTIFLDTDITGTNNTLNINDLSIRTSNKDLELSATCKAASRLPLVDAVKDMKTLKWDADVSRLAIGSTLLNDVLSAYGQGNAVIQRLGNIEYVGNAAGNGADLTAKGVLTTGIGQLTHDVNVKNNHLTAQLATNVLKLGYLLDTEALGDTEITADIAADIVNGNKIPVSNAVVNITAPLLTANGYPYRNTKLSLMQKNDNVTANIDVADVNINALVSATASNISALLEGKPEGLRDISVDASISNLNPNMLGLTKQWQSTTFSTNIKANVASLQNPLERIDAYITDFTMVSPEEPFSFKSIALNAHENAAGEKEISLTSDFADVFASGQFDIATLPQSLTNLVANKLPTLPGLSQYQAQNNNIKLSSTIKDTEILRKLLKVDIDAEREINISGYLNDRLHTADLKLDAPSLKCFGMDFDNTSLHTYCPGDTLSINLTTAKRNYNGSALALNISGKAANNNLQTVLNWRNGRGNAFCGSLYANSRFFMNDRNKPTALVNIMPSEVMISDTLWNLHPSTISYSDNRLSVSKFLIENGKQHVSINGLATKSLNDSLVVDLNDVNVGYIMNLINFHSVEFEGFASGNAVGKALFSEPQAYANLDVRNFLFEGGRLGTLTAHGRWNNDLGQIDIDAQCVDHEVIPLEGSVAEFCSKANDALEGNRDGFLKIDGYISIKRDYIDLGIKADNVRLEFIENYTNSFMSDINAWANGRVNVVGPLSAINLVGEAVANGSVHILPLNTTYTLHNDYVKMVPDDIIFMKDSIYDKHGNGATVSGGLHHQNLGRMTFDLDIDAHHMLCFDFPELNGSTFCGYAKGTGTCQIKGRPGEVNFDIDAYPEESSYIMYDASSPDALQNQEFITWHDNTPRPETQDAVQQDDNTTENRATSSSDVRLNFIVHATPECALRLIMDQRTGDYINLYGNGTLRANYYNKGGMQIFGNYLVERGEYKMTIQQVITKNFEFLPGGSLAFGGDPYEAAIDLQAQYVVPSAPLSDLNIGNSFTSSTVRVNCLMNISGTPEHPVVDFDLNLPQASADIQSMITSLMDSEEARNQQVLYLLAIGRFYAANQNADAVQSQASLAMQSFLSGTVSQQINNLISNLIIKDRNWNFGANISPGDEGMMNAEYEGLVSGRMLNNRLLINGQFGYRDNVNATTSFIGDFDVRYLLFPNGNLQVKVYNQTSDRYFTKSNLNTQGLGIILKHDFKSFIPNFLRKKTKQTIKK